MNDYVNNPDFVQKYLAGNPIKAFGKKHILLPYSFTGLQMAVEKQLDSAAAVKPPIINSTSKSNSLKTFGAGGQCSVIVWITYFNDGAAGNNTTTATTNSMINEAIVEHYAPTGGMSFTYTSAGVNFTGPSSIVSSITPAGIASCMSSLPGISVNTVQETESTCDVGGGAGGGSQPGIFGSNNSNVQVPDANFDNLLAYVQNNGLSISNPFESPFTINGATYTGQITEIYDANGYVVAAYFSPDVTGGQFTVGIEYLVRNSDTDPSGPSYYPILGTPYTGTNGATGTYIGGVGGISSPITINTDTLNKDFPCAVKLIINKLLTIPGYTALVQQFQTAKKPDLVWIDGSLPWHVPVNSANAPPSYTYELGVTSRELTNGSSPALGSTITLNTSMLQNSSQLLIAAAAIHETLHAYINYSLAIAEDDKLNGYINFSNDNWMLSMDQWYVIEGLPSNFRSHFVMMSTYFDQAVNVLKTWDNGAHTAQEYAEAMLYGMNTSDATATPTETADLQQEYNNIMAEYNLTASKITDFNNNQLTAPSSSKLPGNCN